MAYKIKYLSVLLCLFQLQQSPQQNIKYITNEQERCISYTNYINHLII